MTCVNEQSKSDQNVCDWVINMKLSKIVISKHLENHSSDNIPVRVMQNHIHDVHRPASAALSQSPPLGCCPLAGLQWSASQLLPYLGHPHRCVTVQCSWPLGLLSGGLVLQPVLLPGLVVIAGSKWSWCWWLRETPYFLNSYCHNWVQVRYTPHCA